MSQRDLVVCCEASLSSFEEHHPRLAALAAGFVEAVAQADGFPFLYGTATEDYRASRPRREVRTRKHTL